MVDAVDLIANDKNAKAFVEALVPEYFEYGNDDSEEGKNENEKDAPPSKLGYPELKEQPIGET